MFRKMIKYGETLTKNHCLFYYPRGLPTPEKPDEPEEVRTRCTRP